MIEQIVVCVCGVAGVFLSQDPKAQWRRWACIFGLISQPFWFCITWTAGQYLIFALGFLYLFSWLRGFRTHWVQPWAKRRRNRIASVIKRNVCQHGYTGDWSDGCPECRH